MQSIWDTLVNKKAKLPALTERAYLWDVKLKSHRNCMGLGVAPCEVES